MHLKTFEALQGLSLPALGIGWGELAANDLVLEGGGFLEDYYWSLWLFRV